MWTAPGETGVDSDPLKLKHPPFVPAKAGTQAFLPALRALGPRFGGDHGGDDAIQPERIPL